MLFKRCNWCPLPERPSPAHHPYGHPRHELLKTWAEVAAGLRRAGWVVEYAPLPGWPDYAWRSPDGVTGLDYRSSDPDAPPDAVMHRARELGHVGFAELAPR